MTYALYPAPISKDTKTIERSKQSPICHFTTLSGAGIIFGNSVGGFNSSYSKYSLTNLAHFL